MRVEFVATTADRLSNVPIKEGQMIAVVDQLGYYYDFNNIRYNVSAGGGGGGSNVQFIQTLLAGTKIGEIVIDGAATTVFAPTPPTATSELTNDAGFISASVNNLINYYLKDDTYTKDEVNALIETVSGIQFEIVETLPTTDIKQNIIYLVPKDDPQVQDIKEEYINITGTPDGWERIGDTSIDLSGYVTDDELTAALAAYVTNSDLTTVLSNYARIVDIPTKTSDLTNDSGFVTSAEIPTKTSELTNDSNFVVDANYVHTDNNYTSSDRTKLQNIQSNAEVNVQSDWAETNTNADSYIKNKPDRVGASSLYYGTCETASDVAIKQIVLADDAEFKLDDGVTICVAFTNTNTASVPSLQIVNHGDSKRIKKSPSAYVLNGNGAGVADSYTLYTYDGTNWVWLTDTYSAGTTPSQLGIGYAQCWSAADTTEKIGTLENYHLLEGGIVACYFANDVLAESTLAINDQAACPIYYKGAAIESGVINGNDTIIFAYSNGIYHMLCKDMLGNGSIVTWNQSFATGIKIATIGIDGVLTNVYAPSQTTVSAKTIQPSGYEIGTITIDGSTKYFYSPKYYAGNGIAINDSIREISVNEASAEDMTEIISPLPGVMSRRFTYSEDEQVVGTWIDGKPIYQKTIVTTTPNCTKDGTAVAKAVAVGASIDTVASFKGFAYNTNAWFDLPRYSYSAGNLMRALVITINDNTATSDKNCIRISNSYTNWSNNNCIVTVQYTKTTD